jgi:hypothetical protein
MGRTPKLPAKNYLTSKMKTVIDESHLRPMNSGERTEFNLENNCQSRRNAEIFRILPRTAP